MKVIEVKQVERAEVKLMACDLCGRETQLSSWVDLSDVKKLTTVRVEMTEVSRLFSNASLKEVTTTSFDICPDCFKSVVMETLMSKQAVPTILTE